MIGLISTTFVRLCLQQTLTAASSLAQVYFYRQGPLLPDAPVKVSLRPTSLAVPSISPWSHQHPLWQQCIQVLIIRNRKIDLFDFIVPFCGLDMNLVSTVASWPAPSITVPSITVPMTATHTLGVSTTSPIPTTAGSIVTKDVIVTLSAVIGGIIVLVASTATLLVICCCCQRCPFCRHKGELQLTIVAHTFTWAHICMYFSVHLYLLNHDVKPAMSRWSTIKGIFLLHKFLSTKNLTCLTFADEWVMCTFYSPFKIWGFHSSHMTSPKNRTQRKLPFYGTSRINSNTDRVTKYVCAYIKFQL